MAQHGTFMWNELATGDVERAKTFHGELLGWTYEAMPMGESGSYTIIQSAGTQAGGMLPLAAIPGGEGIPPHWMSSIAVDDVDARTARVADRGGKVVREPFDIPGVGRMSVIQDATGAIVALITMTEGAG